MGAKTPTPAEPTPEKPALSLDEVVTLLLGIDTRFLQPLARLRDIALGAQAAQHALTGTERDLEAARRALAELRDLHTKALAAHEAKLEAMDRDAGARREAEEQGMRQRLAAVRQEVAGLEAKRATLVEAVTVAEKMSAERVKAASAAATTAENARDEIQRQLEAIKARLSG